MKNIILASTATLHGQKYLEYLLPEIKMLFHDCKEIVFVPYAQPNGMGYDDYTHIVQTAFAEININVKGIHQYKSPTAAIEQARGIFVGGGNTFLLVKQLYQENIMQLLSDRVNQGMPYLGTSAGSNIGGPNMQTTNDMPIVMPPSYETMNVIPFNINPHYVEYQPNSKHMGESRATRINEFQTLNPQAVLGLKEGSWLRIMDKNIVLKGNLTAKLFVKDKDAIEIHPNEVLSFLQ
jgi:dipeptidase E